MIIIIVHLRTTHRTLVVLINNQISVLRMKNECCRAYLISLSTQNCYHSAEEIIYFPIYSNNV